MANTRTRTVPVEGAIATFHSEVKLGPCTSVLRIVLHDIIINTLYIVSLYTIFRITHQGTFILHVFINTDWCFTTFTTIMKSTKVQTLGIPTHTFPVHHGMTTCTDKLRSQFDFRIECSNGTFYKHSPCTCVGHSFLILSSLMQLYMQCFRGSHACNACPILL